MAELLWATVIAYMLYKIVNSTSSVAVPIFTYNVLFVCWGLPLVVTLLPLTTNSYGVYDGTTGWCFIKDRSDSPPWGSEVWTIFAFYFWFWVGLFLYFALIAYVSYEIKYSKQDSFITPLVKRALEKLPWYPLNIIFCWGYTAVYDNMAQFNAEAFPTSFLSSYFNNILPCFIGILNSFSFLYSNKEARDFLKESFYMLVYYATSIFYKHTMPVLPLDDDKSLEPVDDPLENQMSVMYTDNVNVVNVTPYRMEDIPEGFVIVEDLTYPF